MVYQLATPQLDAVLSDLEIRTDWLTHDDDGDCSSGARRNLSRGCRWR
jgi:hypothetical protein